MRDLNLLLTIVIIITHDFTAHRCVKCSNYATISNASSPYCCCIMVSAVSVKCSVMMF